MGSDLAVSQVLARGKAGGPRAPDTGERHKKKMQGTGHVHHVTLANRERVSTTWRWDCRRAAACSPLSASAPLGRGAHPGPSEPGCPFFLSEALRKLRARSKTHEKKICVAPATRQTGLEQDAAATQW